jgi:hypothetical protein
MITHTKYCRRARVERINDRCLALLITGRCLNKMRFLRAGDLFPNQGHASPAMSTRLVSHHGSSHHAPTRTKSITTMGVDVGVPLRRMYPRKIPQLSILCLFHGNGAACLNIIINQFLSCGYNECLFSLSALPLEKDQRGKSFAWLTPKEIGRMTIAKWAAPCPQKSHLALDEISA